MPDPAGIIVTMSKSEKAALRSIKAKMAFSHNLILEQRGALKLYKKKNRRADIRHRNIKIRPTQYSTLSL